MADDNVPILRTGYDFECLVTLLLDGVPFPFNGGTVSCSLKNGTKTTELIDDTAQVDSMPGAWASGLLCIRFGAEDTGNAAVVDVIGDKGTVAGYIEIALTKDGARYPFRDVPIRMERGFNES